MTAGRMHLATSDLPERDRVPYMRDFYGRTMMGLEIAPITEAGFDMEMNVMLLDRVGIACGRVSPIKANRTQGLVRDGNGNILLGYYDAGFGHSDPRSGDVWIGRRDILAMPLDRCFDWTFAAPGTTTAIHLDRQALSALIPRYDLDGMNLLSGDRPGMDLLFPYARAILNARDMTGALAALASRQILELAAFILSDARHPDEVGAGDSLRAARLAAIKRDVTDSFHVPGLSVRDIAARHRISVRYVQLLFEQEGTTFTEYLQNTRLEFAFARVVNAADRTRILDIAMEAGFADLSTFNRRFRRRYGDTPSAVRANARRPYLGGQIPHSG